MTAFLICTLVVLGLIALFDVIMVIGADPHSPKQMVGVGIILWHAVPLIMAIIAVALGLAR